MFSDMTPSFPSHTHTSQFIQPPNSTSFNVQPKLNFCTIMNRNHGLISVLVLLCKNIFSVTILQAAHPLISLSIIKVQKPYPQSGDVLFGRTLQSFFSFFRVARVLLLEEKYKKQNMRMSWKSSAKDFKLAYFLYSCKTPSFKTQKSQKCSEILQRKMLISFWLCF